MAAENTAWQTTNKQIKTTVPGKSSLCLPNEKKINKTGYLWRENIGFMFLMISVQIEKGSGQTTGHKLHSTSSASV